MKKLRHFGLLLVAVFVMGCGAGDPVPKRIFYAGDPDTRHMESFRELLEQHFESVRTIPLLDVGTADLSDADVLIIDGLPIKRGDDGPSVVKTPQGVVLDTLSVPTVLIGGMGGRISDSLSLKIGWRYG